MSKLDPKTRKVLDFIRDRIDAMPHGERLQIAKICKIDPATITHLMDKENLPNYHPRAGTVLRILGEITGRFPIEIEGNEPLLNLAPCANEKLIKEIAQGARQLATEDVQLIYQFYDILKNKNLIEPHWWKHFMNTLETFQKEVIK